MSWTNGGAEPGDIHQYAEDLAASVTSSLSGQQRNGQANGSGNDNMAARAQQDDLAVAQNGGLMSQDITDDGELDGEESDLDDDMMDKISSSPSIDDGGSFCQLPSLDSVPPDASPGSSPMPPCFSEARSSSPYLDLPVYLPLQHELHQQTSRRSRKGPFRHHHLPGAFLEDLDDQSCDNGTTPNMDDAEDQSEHARVGNDSNGPDRGTDRRTGTRPRATSVEKEQSEVSAQRIQRSIPTDYEPDNPTEADEDDEEDGLTIPYEGSTDDDDDDLFLQSTTPDPRFIDSGWGGECLQDTEDIDFELVYALHTFIATVEGQANATKGDAMVLLDDSNSYWWLVRVVKDSSIGKNMSSLINFEV